MSNKGKVTEGKVKKRVWEKFRELYAMHPIKGYVYNVNKIKDTIKDNLLDDIPEDALDPIIEELGEGDGKELKKKFHAIHSSAALVVNIFGYWKKCPERVKFLNHTGFKSMEFEKKLPTDDNPKGNADTKRMMRTTKDGVS